MKIVFESKRGIKLVGILNNSSTRKCIILAHGIFVDKDSRGTFIKVSEELQKEGFAVFRFDFGGHGESENASISLEGEEKDLISAINLMKEKYSKIGVLGHSLGGLISLKTANYADAIIAWAPNTEGGNIGSLSRIEKKEREKDYLIIKQEKEYSVAKKYVDERINLNQEELISKIKKPTLIIHGSDDEIIPVKQTINAEQYLKNGKIKILDKEKHNFKQKLDEAINLSTDWFKHYL